MFGSLGVPELLFIFGLALLVFGPKRLPQIGRTLGRGMAEFRKASTELRRTLNTEMLEQEIRDNDPRRLVRDSLREVKDGLTGAIDPNTSGGPGSGPATTTAIEDGDDAAVEGGIDAAVEDGTDAAVEGGIDAAVEGGTEDGIDAAVDGGIEGAVARDGRRKAPEAAEAEITTTEEGEKASSEAGHQP